MLRNMTNHRCCSVSRWSTWLCNQIKHCSCLIAQNNNLLAITKCIESLDVMSKLKVAIQLVATIAKSLEPSLLLWWLWNVFGKELVGRVIITDIPEILGHGNNERANNQNGKNGGVLSCKFRIGAHEIYETFKFTEPYRFNYPSLSLSPWHS